MFLKLFSTMISASIVVAGAGFFNGNPAFAQSGGSYPAYIIQQAECAGYGNKLYCFTVLEDKKVYLRIQTTAGDNNSYWPDEYTRLYAPSGVTLTGNITAAKSNNVVYVFCTAMSGDRRLWYRRQYSPGSTRFTSWSLFQQPLGYGKIQAITTTDNRVAVFSRDVNGSIFCYMQDKVCTMLGNLSTYNNFTVARNGDGRLEVFAPYTNYVMHIWEETAGSNTWATDWTQLSASAPSWINVDADLACMTNQGGGLEIFINTTNGNVYNCWQEPNTPGGWANYWNPICNTGKVYKRMVAGKRADGGCVLLYAIAPPPGQVQCFINFYSQAPGSNAWDDKGAFKPSNPPDAGVQPWIRSTDIDRTNMILLNNPATSKLHYYMICNYASNPLEAYVQYSYENSSAYGWSHVYQTGGEGD